MVSVSEKILGIIKRLRVHGKDTFDNLMLLCENRSELVASFMAILELAKARRIELEENENGELHIILNTTRKAVRNNAE